MSQMIEERDWRYAWIKRTVERMEELKQRGERDVTLHIEEFQRILRELLAMHQRSDRLEDVLCSYARYAFPVTQRIVPPQMFGGSIADSRTVSGRMPSNGSTVTQVDKQKAVVDAVLNKHRHVFYYSGKSQGYNICDCGVSDTYYNWEYNKK